MADRTLFQSILDEKSITPEQVRREFKKLCKYDLSDNKRSFAGNPILYNYMTEVLCMTKNDKGMCIKDEAENPERREYWFKQMEKLKRTGTVPIRFFECLRMCRLGINFFKPTVAMFLYNSLKAKKVLDPCAGWGGRLLGAMALGIDYIGFDTNLLLREPYKRMMNDICPEANHLDREILPIDDEIATFDYWRTENNHYSMVWGSSLEVDFSDITYDTVLTSPPYYNLEIYPGMTPYESEAKFYKEFLIPLINKCIAGCQLGGNICFNISPPMYKKLTKTFKFRECDWSMDMLQQKRLGKDKEDKIYVWVKV